MSVKINLDVDDSEALSKVDHIEDRIEGTKEKLTDMVDDVETGAKNSFNKVMGMMRASYMMVSGITQAIGGSMSQVFSSIFSVAISSIMTYKAIAAASMATPGGQAQAILMYTSLVTAMANLSVAITGQKELSRQISGLNMTLQGIGSLIGYVPNLW